MIRTLCFAFALLLAAGSAQAASPAAPAPCSDAEYRQMDFWVGDWDLEFASGPGKVSHAQSHITKDEFGSCVIAEHMTLPTDNYVGASFSTWSKSTNVWLRTWVDNGGGIIRLEGGPATDKPWDFELRSTEPMGANQQHYRLIWHDVKPNSLTTRWQTEQPDGTWADVLVIRYKRHKA